MPPVREMRSVISMKLGGNAPPRSCTNSTIAVGRAFAKLPAVDIDAAHARVRGERNERRASCSATSRPRRPYFSLASTTIERPSGVSSARLESCAASASSLSRDAVDRQELDRLAVAERDGAGLVEQQRVHVARRFDRLAAHGEHVVLHHAVHAGDADGREQAADGRRNQADQQRDQHRDGRRRAGARRADAVDRERLQRRPPPAGRSASDPAIRMFSAISFGVFCRSRAFDQRDHAIEERLAGIGGDPDLDLVGEHLACRR